MLTEPSPIICLSEKAHQFQKALNYYLMALKVALESLNIMVVVR